MPSLDAVTETVLALIRQFPGTPASRLTVSQRYRYDCLKRLEAAGKIVFRAGGWYPAEHDFELADETPAVPQVTVGTELACGTRIVVPPGSWFTLVLPDGSELSVEQTGDDFSIDEDRGETTVGSDGEPVRCRHVCYTRATSGAAKGDDRNRGCGKTVTGYN